MTWGTQVAEADAHAQLDCAIAHGINFFDTAEMYAIPRNETSVGATERIIGNWFARRGQRDKVILATKVVGQGRGLFYIRDGKARLDRANIVAAVDGSLQRLRTDYIDLYQLHWPDRNVPLFGGFGYTHANDESAIPLAETLSVLQDFLRAGKIREIGLSNETPWGLMQCLHLQQTENLPRVQSVQNIYNLLARVDELGMTEIYHRERVALLGYSPLAFGVLSGKYHDPARIPDANARLVQHKGVFPRFETAHSHAPIVKYLQLAKAHGLTLTQLALSFAYHRPFMASTIIGASSVAQLEENIAAWSVRLSPEILAAIETIHRAHPNPCP
jgi:aryl-alcohol dehydrogenase-like predicted oxidoreductase